MSTIVFHSSSLGVTEYDQTFTGLAGDFEATRDGLYRVEGQDDDGALVNFLATMGINAEHSTLKRVPMSAYVQADTESELTAVVRTPAGVDYPYPQQFVSGRTRRFIFGRGIRDAYLGFSLLNADGKAARIDRIEINTRDSAQRKVT
jgi:hypothetical protein